MKAKILFLLHSNAGQTRRAVDELAKGICASSSAEISYIELMDAKEYPFPWGFYEFFSIFPECAIEKPDPLTINPQPILSDYDLIVIAYPIWFLSPSLPLQAFFKSHLADGLKGKPIVSLITCRNMWVEAGQRVTQWISEKGGALVDTIVLADRSPPWTTFITTPVWMLTGNKKLPMLPEAGIQEEDYLRLREWGQLIGDTVSSGANNWHKPSLDQVETIALQEKYILPEKVLKNLLFKPAAFGIYHLSRFLPIVRKPFVYLFLVFLVFSILILIPIVLVMKIFLRIFFKDIGESLRKKALYPYHQ
ncbi:MAG: hypothetical protein HQL32_03160 [Planctomycetes bacterium]|nr:hypothetical protein [Planctomycetota bacterium]